jgi:chromosome partitioning protein
VGRVLCVANQKGGVGKTTTAVNLGAGLAKAGRRTLLIDLDPQCNATTGLGIEPTMRHWLISDKPIRESMQNAYLPELFLLPGSRSFRDIDLLARADHGEAAKLADQITTASAAFEFVLIDCPPSAGPLTQTALACANELLMPVQCEYYAMEGLTQMIQVVRKVMKTHKTGLEFGGIVLTMHDHRLELAREVDAEVREFFGGVVFETVIPRDVAAAEAPSHGKSVMDYDPRSRSARAYIELCMEVLERD